MTKTNHGHFFPHVSPGTFSLAINLASNNVDACLFGKLRDVFKLKISFVSCRIRFVTRTIKTPVSLDFEDVTKTSLLV